MALADTAALVSSLELQDKFSKTVDKYEKSLGSMEKKTGTFDSVLGKANKGLGTLAHNLGNIAAIGVGAAVAGIAFSIRSASNLEESLSKVNVVFGESADEIEAWAETAAAGFGQSKQQALEAAGTFGNLFRAFGLSAKPTEEMSTNLVELAADLASFNNTSVDDALLALRSGLSGETEPLKRFGVSLTEARLKQEALRLGLIKTTKTALTPAQKAQAAYAVILHDTALAQGDFERTSGGLANQQRILRANLENVAATVGTALLPKITELAVKFNELLTENQDTITDLANKLPGLFDTVAAIVMNLPWEAMGTAFGIMGEGLLAILDAFSKFPPELQTTIIALAGINKLTGGAVTGIASELAKGVIKGVLGITAAVVNIKAATVVGGGGAPVAGGKPGGGFPFGSIGAFIGGAIGALGLGELTRGGGELDPNVQAVAIATALRRGDPLDVALAGRSQAAISALLADTSLQSGLTKDQLDALSDVVNETHELNLKETGSRSAATREARQTQQQIENLRGVAEHHRREDGAGFTSAAAAAARAKEQAQADAVKALQAQSAAQVKLQQIADKDFRPTITVGVTSNVSITDITRRLMQQHMSITAGSIGGT